jgi:S1-C subfamily serine protease
VRIAPGSPAEDVLRPGDVILSIDGKAVTDPGDATRRLRESKDPAHPVLLQIRRGDRTIFVAVAAHAGG